MKISHLVGCIGLIVSTQSDASSDAIKNSLYQLQADVLNKSAHINNHVMQPIVDVDVMYNPITGAHLLVKLTEPALPQSITGNTLQAIQIEQKAPYLKALQESKTLSHDIYQLERKIKTLKDSAANVDTLNDLKRQLASLTIQKANANNQYKSAKSTLLEIGLKSQTLDQLETTIVNNVCSWDEDTHQKLNQLTVTITGLMNEQRQLNWHFANTQTCQQNSQETKQALSTAKTTYWF